MYGYEGIYIVSNKGRVVRTEGWTNGRQLKPSYHLYVRVMLSRNNHVQFLLLHRVVYEAFNGPIPAGLEINHKNGDKHDNRLENLEAITRMENTRHAYAYLNKASTAPRGTEHVRHKLDERDVQAMRELRRNGVPFKKIAGKFGISYSATWQAVNGRTWSHVLL